MVRYFSLSRSRR